MVTPMRTRGSAVAVVLDVVDVPGSAFRSGTTDATSRNHVDE